MYGCSSIFTQRWLKRILLNASHPNQFDRLPHNFKELKVKQSEQMLKVEKIDKPVMVPLLILSAKNSIDKESLSGKNNLR